MPKTLYHGPKLFSLPDFGRDRKKIIIRPVGDIHYGNPAQNEKLVKELIYELKHDPDQYWINAGDMLENNGKEQNHDGVWHDTLTPEQQLDAYIEDFSPVVHKLICAVGGNHDHRTRNRAQIDLMRRAAREMGYADRYVTDGAFAYIRLGSRTQAGRRRARAGRPCTYRLYVTHGSSAGATSGSKANALEKMGNVVLADVYIGAHTHSQMVFRDRYYYHDENDRNQLSYLDRWFVNTGSALEYGGYATTARYTPQPPGFPFICLSGEQEHIEVTMK